MISGCSSSRMMIACARFALVPVLAPKLITALAAPVPGPKILLVGLHLPGICSASRPASCQFAAED